MHACRQTLVVYLFSFLSRFILTGLSLVIFVFLGLSEPMTLNQIIFVSVAGLRGSLSLILVQTVIQLGAESQTGVNNTYNANSQGAINPYHGQRILAPLTVVVDAQSWPRSP